MQIFDQQDYPNDYLGNTKYTIARWGCLDTVVVMIYDYIFNKKMNPAQAGQILLFTVDGLLIWASLKKLNLKLKSRVRFYNKIAIDKAYKTDDEFIALEVNNSHWVWVIGRYIPYWGYRIVDPIGGKKGYSGKYNAITGHAIIVKDDSNDCSEQLEDVEKYKEKLAKAEKELKECQSN